LVIEGPEIVILDMDADCAGDAATERVASGKRTRQWSRRSCANPNWSAAADTPAQLNVAETVSSQPGSENEMLAFATPVNGLKKKLFPVLLGATFATVTDLLSLPTPLSSSVKVMLTVVVASSPQVQSKLPLRLPLLPVTV
jgi:hypothetical protein